MTLVVPDFRQIKDWRVEDHNAIFESVIAWLREQVAAVAKDNKSLSKRQPKRIILVVTHHALSKEEAARPNYVGNSWSSAFSTDLITDLITAKEHWGNVKTCWVFGHPDYTNEFKKCGITVVGNQGGYVLLGSEKCKREVKDRKKEYNVRRVIRLSYVHLWI